MTKVLITGITGFLGSHIAENLIRDNVQVIGLKRANSDTWRCRDFEDRIEWIDFDKLDCWQNSLVSKTSITVIHCAWVGVEAQERDNWALQSSNIDLLIKLFNLKSYINIEKFIIMGSQAEYGVVNSIVSEDFEVSPTNAYGYVKLACLQLLKGFSSQHRMKWLWLRVFSVFGEKENSNWLIPSMIKSMKDGVKMQFTLGEQKYAYLYANDFSKLIGKLVLNDVSAGVYNISSNQVMQLKSLIEFIRDEVNPNYNLNFGSIPYRDNQSMHIEGDIRKLMGEIGPFEFTDFNVALSNTIDYYISN